MKLSELFSILTYGELASLKQGGKDDGGIHPMYSEEVLTYIRQGLTDLHTRFPLKQGELIIQLQEELTRYLLTSEHAYSNEESEAYYKYIDDLGMYPFEDDIISIEQVFNEIGEEMLLNEESPRCQHFTPQYNVLQVTNPENDNALAVLYRADHKPIELNADSDPSKIDIDIPSTLVNSLCLYVSAMAHNAIGTTEGLNTGLAKLQMYEASCIQADRHNIVNGPVFDSTRLVHNGWV